MRRRHCRIGLVVLALLALAQAGWTQERVPLTIRSVTSETLPNGEVVLVITGVGFGATPTVIVDGQQVDVLPDLSDTRITVLAPPTVLTTPGTYRLTVANPARRLRDEFVVASPPGAAVVAEAPLAGAGGGTGSTGSASPSKGAVGRQWRRAACAAHPERGRARRRCGTLHHQDWLSGALQQQPERLVRRGHHGLLQHREWVPGDVVEHHGLQQHASGAYALYANTTGYHNTASGRGALFANTWGWDNTASGYEALRATPRAATTRQSAEGRSMPTPRATTTRPPATRHSMPIPRARTTRPAAVTRSPATRRATATRPPAIGALFHNTDGGPQHGAR